MPFLQDPLEIEVSLNISVENVIQLFYLYIPPPALVSKNNNNVQSEKQFNQLEVQIQHQLAVRQDDNLYNIGSITLPPNFVNATEQGRGSTTGGAMRDQDEIVVAVGRSMLCHLCQSCNLLSLSPPSLSLSHTLSLN